MRTHNLNSILKVVQAQSTIDQLLFLSSITNSKMQIKIALFEYSIHFKVVFIADTASLPVVYPYWLAHRVRFIALGRDYSLP